MISNAIQKNYTESQTLLKFISDPNLVDKKQIQAKMYIEQGELLKAAKLVEEKLLLLNTEVHDTLLYLMDIAIKDKPYDDADYIANVDEQATKILFDLWEYNKYLAHFKLYSALKDRVKLLKIFVPMIKSLTKKWDANKSPLYKHIKTKEVDKDFGKMQKNILKSISEDEEISFLKESSELEDFLMEFNE